MSEEQQTKKAKMTDRTIINAAGAPPAIGPYSQAVKAGGMIYCSGCLGMDPTTKQLVEGGVQAQTRRVLDNMKAILEVHLLLTNSFHFLSFHPFACGAIVPFHWHDTYSFNL